jgi:hypothetical protein
MRLRWRGRGGKGGEGGREKQTGLITGPGLHNGGAGRKALTVYSRAGQHWTLQAGPSCSAPLESLLLREPRFSSQASKLVGCSSPQPPPDTRVALPHWSQLLHMPSGLQSISTVIPRITWPGQVDTALMVTVSLCPKRKKQSL